MGNNYLFAVANKETPIFRSKKSNHTGIVSSIRNESSLTEDEKDFLRQVLISSGVSRRNIQEMVG